MPGRPEAGPPMTEPYLLLSLDRGQASPSGEPTYRAGWPLAQSERDRPDGPFAAWSWDGDTLRARNDRYGIGPLYYAAWAGRIAISPSVRTLLALGAPTDLDEAALAVFLRLGFFLGEDTPVRAIRALPPDATLSWRAGRLRVSGRLSVARPQALSRSAAIDGYIGLFRAAIARRLVPDDDVAVPLSGGRDSRHILLELCRAGRRPRLCVTMRHFPPRPDEDAVVAAEVARAVGVPHVVLPQRGTRIAAEVRKNRITGFCADEHAWILPLADYLSGRVRHVYDGIGGDVLSSGLFLTAERLALFEAGRFEDLAALLFECPESRLARLLAPGWAARLGRDVAIARLVTELARHADAPNPVGSFYFWNRTRREIALAPYRILGRRTEVLSPYLDHDLYDFLASLPAASLLDRELHSDTIRRGYPEYRDLRFEDKDAAPPRAPGELRRFARGLAAYAVRTSSMRLRVRLVRGGFVLARALWSTLDGDSPRFDRLAPVLAVYLMQLSREIERPAGAGAAGRAG